MLKLEKQYPNDVGVLAALLFNHLKLNPGEALYIGANEPHAYLTGECVECMAASDNVVRAGLTPKYMDVKILCSMLTYNQVTSQSLYFFKGILGNSQMVMSCKKLKTIVFWEFFLFNNHLYCLFSNQAIKVSDIFSPKLTGFG